MVKARVHSWTDEYIDEDGTMWDAYLSISTPDEEDIDFEAGFPTQQDADAWRTQFEELVDGCTVSVSDWREQYGHDPDLREEKERVCYALGCRIEALETLLRDAYTFLPHDLQVRADTLLKAEKQIVDADA